MAVRLHQVFHLSSFLILYIPNSDRTKNNQLTCLCINARSILPKRHDLFTLMCSFDIDILVVTETFLDPTIVDAEVCPQDYMVFCKYCSRHGGGVLLLAKKHLKILCRDDLNQFCDELLFVEISIVATTVLLGAFYWPPSSDFNSLLALNSCLLSISRCPLVLCGDFNVPSIDWHTVSPTVSSSAATVMCDLVQENFLH